MEEHSSPHVRAKKVQSRGSHAIWAAKRFGATVSIVLDPGPAMIGTCDAHDLVATSPLSRAGRTLRAVRLGGSHLSNLIVERVGMSTVPIRSVLDARSNGAEPMSFGGG
ncbi:hypothetical protein NL676_033406 [Syzygium grande]|nr:hypothetical protein NL676_033406 [Syzygium grande]